MRFLGVVCVGEKVRGVSLALFGVSVGIVKS